MESISRYWFAVAGIILILLATGLLVTGVYEVIAAMLSAERVLHQRLLTAVGYAVISVAVFDVAKYILEEEVVRERELRHVSEVRRSLTRFTSTILIAVLLEGIVLIFKVAEDDVANIVYPTLLLLAGVAMLVGLGVFQRFSVKAEREVGQKDDRDERVSNGKTAKG